MATSDPCPWVVPSYTEWGWTVWPTQYCGSNDTWFLKLSHERYCSSAWSLRHSTLWEANCHDVRILRLSVNRHTYWGTEARYVLPKSLNPTSLWSGPWLGQGEFGLLWSSATLTNKLYIWPSGLFVPSLQKMSFGVFF